MPIFSHRTHITSSLLVTEIADLISFSSVMASVDEFSVSVKETVLVSPLAALQPLPKVVNLSNLDRQCPLLMYLVFFYKHPTTMFDHDHNLWSLDSVFQSLKSGFEETLSTWYPAAGRLIMTRSYDDNNVVDLDSDGRSNGNSKQFLLGRRLNLLCNNEGAILVKAVTEVELSELGDLSQYNHFFDNLVYKQRPVYDDPHGDHFSLMPLVAAQVTKFGCGGYSIGIGISHSLFDGPAAYEFMYACASNSVVTQSNLHIMEQPKLVKPVHDRETLLTINCSRDDEDGRDKGISRATTAIDHLYQLMMQSAGTVASTDLQTIKTTSIDDANAYVHKTFHLSGAFINCLKKQFVADNFSCSSFELLAAHLWKAKTMALGLSKETMVCLQFAVDVRNKVDPPLPQGFTGNAYVLASVALTASQLVEESDHKTIVDKIRQAKKCVTNKYVKSYMDALAAAPAADGGTHTTSLPPLKELTLVSDWTRMPFHKVGFLRQEAAYASPLVAPVPEVICFMQNPKDDKGIDMRIGLLPQHLDAFTRYFLDH